MDILKLLTQHANETRKPIKSLSKGLLTSFFIQEGENNYGVDIMPNKKQLAFTWGLPENHIWVTLCNHHNISVDIM